MNPTSTRGDYDWSVRRSPNLKSFLAMAVLIAYATTPGMTQGRSSSRVSASGLTISNVEVVPATAAAGDARVRFDIRWQHAWRTARNHDAAWVFFKRIGDGDPVHVQIAGDGHTARPTSGGGVAARIDVGPDRSGFLIYPADGYRGEAAWHVEVRIASEGNIGQPGSGELSVFGIEMVQIPEGPFYVGDPNPTAVEFGSFYQAGANGESADYYHVASEAEIPVGASAGRLHYPQGEYLGDRQGPIPSAFPKGFDEFYIMKYELTQGQYVAFVNTLSEGDREHRIHIDDASYLEKRGTIRLDGNRYVADQPNRPLNYMHWDDGLAFSDWAALRPITEFEFAKAARGPERPLPNTFPWGTDSRETLARLVDPDADLVMTNGWDEGRLTDETRPIFGASYYWVMDLAGSVWERVVTPSRADGRRFTGSNGDGTLADSARATNPDWPHGFLGQEGHGYRGGGFYDQGREPHEFNPWSPVAYRRFGGWSGYDVHRAYGYRAGLSK